MPREGQCPTVAPARLSEGARQAACTVVPQGDQSLGHGPEQDGMPRTSEPSRSHAVRVRVRDGDDDGTGSGHIEP